MVDLVHGTKRKRFSNHSLVLLSFYGNRPNGYEGCHFPDINTTNNDLSNLMWGTPKINRNHAVLGNTIAFGSRHGSARLNEMDVAVIRSLLATTSMSNPTIASKFYGNPNRNGCIGLIRDRKIWKRNDDIGGCVDWLIKEGHWKGTESNVSAPEFNFSGKKEKLIHRIEEEALELDLQILVSKVWQQIEEACVVDRKPRYE